MFEQVTVQQMEVSETSMIVHNYDDTTIVLPSTAVKTIKTVREQAEN